MQLWDSQSRPSLPEKCSRDFVFPFFTYSLFGRDMLYYTEYSIIRRIRDCMFDDRCKRTHRWNQIQAFCHAFSISFYPQNFDVMKFSRQIDCYHMLFISGWLVRNVGLRLKATVGFTLWSLKWLKSIHFNWAFRHVSRACGFAFTYRDEFVCLLIKLDTSWRYEW